MGSYTNRRIEHPFTPESYCWVTGYYLNTPYYAPGKDCVTRLIRNREQKQLLVGLIDVRVFSARRGRVEERSYAAAKAVDGLFARGPS